MKKMYLLGLIVSATMTVGAAEKRVMVRNDFYSAHAPVAAKDGDTGFGTVNADAEDDAKEGSRCCRLWNSVRRNKKRIAAVGGLAVATAYYFRDPICVALGLQPPQDVKACYESMRQAFARGTAFHPGANYKEICDYHLKGYWPSSRECSVKAAEEIAWSLHRSNLTEYCRYLLDPELYCTSKAAEKKL